MPTPSSFKGSRAKYLLLLLISRRKLCTRASQDGPLVVSSLRVPKASTPINIPKGHQSSKFHTDIQCPWRVLPPTMPNVIENISNTSFEQAAFWIKQCVATHGCGSIATPELPNRVIDIGESFGNDAIRLIETCGTTRGQYICLSHCWGGYQPLKTTSATMPLHLSSLVWEDIPGTYRDAMKFCNFLTIRYLWIDSLCIIQDDRTDWARESAKMCSIYENAYLTIAATSSENPSRGLHSRDSRQRLLANIRGRTSGGMPFNVFALEDILHPGEDMDPRRELSTWPLLSRGWALQERLLSARVVHFCSPEMIWECRHVTLCECGHLQSNNSHQRLWSSYAKGNESCQLWHDVVEEYSRLTLSYPSDKFPAFSGVAKFMAKKRALPEDQYVAGLWMDSIVEDLLWTVVDQSLWHEVAYGVTPVINCMEPTTTPSWSWAHSRFPVVFPFSRYYFAATDPRLGMIEKTYIRLLDVEVFLATQDSTGALQGASLYVESIMFGACLWRGQGSLATDEWQLSIDDTTHRFYSKHGVDTDLLLDGPIHVASGTGIIGEKVSVSCLRIALGKRIRASQVQESEYAMIVQCINPKENTYRRLGMFIQLRTSRLSDESVQLPSPWTQDPSFFQIGGVHRRIMLV
jgi:hypothetical protein